jgi:hypothetical protein
MGELSRFCVKDTKKFVGSRENAVLKTVKLDLTVMYGSFYRRQRVGCESICPLAVIQ